jgi:hypothetical protein
MKLSFHRLILITVFLLFPHISNSKTKTINYFDPVPFSKYVKTQTQLIIKTGDYFEVTSAKGVISVLGSKSGLHNGKFFFAENNKALIFQPERNFSYAETVFVKIKSGLKTSTGDKIEPYAYYFLTCSEDINVDAAEIFSKEIGIDNISIDSLPGDFPTITINYTNNPSSGYIFISNLSFGAHTNSPYLIICSNSGEPYYYKRIGTPCYDFKMQPNGNLTYYNNNRGKFYELNSNYQLIDSFYCRNGYTTDLHELRVLNNGHVLLLSYDIQIVDMSIIIQGGNPAARVTGLIIQELDENRNVVFQWRSWDHFQITDATHQNFLSPQIDYVHGNAIEIDNDGNLMLSSRHMDEITKIDHNTGNIIWRLGGKNNQFTFINDSLKFSYQHAVRRIANSHITLFDNGNYHNPPFSRAIEYDVDDVNKTATLVWEYRNSPSIFSPAMGNVQRLSNGNTLICWGQESPTVTEVTPQGNRSLELTFDNGVYSYRAFRDDWNGPMVGLNENNVTVPEKFNLYQNYPNPFNPTTVIKFDLPGSSKVKLSVYDQLGREVSILLNSNLSAGSYRYNWDASNFCSGVYFYRLVTNDAVETKRMALVK